ncbi:c-type cytochrome biogenesis protein CcmI [Thiobacillus sp. 0-1251]|uniref:c-type cytochrome biogenesis protein CcmI n=1 Tax=Thiobacillus sp. 0-1251 TaxID=1895858 RepID=UPI0009677BD4|nr:c-type cytochrome biogenesis protein CcmI [Thiobacillus sp. 0-1251]OJY55194.1 MAG: c-type cytochrome biogenesis protein CcmI [Thiobacillus sp. 0-1251]
MTGFFIVIGVLIALGLAFVLPALVRQRGKDDRNMRAQANVLIYRDQIKELDADLANGTLSAEQHAAGRRELEKRALEDTLAAVSEATPAQSQRAAWAPIALAVLIPAVAVGMYLKLGTPLAIAPSDSTLRVAAAPANAQAQDGSPHSTSFDAIRAMAEKLAARLKDNPDDGAGWAMLARSYNVLGRFAEASEAYSQAEKRLPPDAQLMADHADALAMSQGQKLDGEPLAMLQRALKIDPANLKALALMGTAAFDRKDYKGAIGYWEKVVQTAPADSEFTQSLQASLDEARALAEGRTPPAALPSIMQAPQEAAAPAAANGVRVSGQVKLAPALAAKVSPGDTLFIFARAENGPRMPLAILSQKAGELPSRFSLDDSNSMAPGMKLSAFPSVMVVARISKSGNASAQSGDLEGSVGPLKPGTQDIQINIDKVIP